MSRLQTKNWRKLQTWYINGKKNECEKFQRRQIETIIGLKTKKTNLRLNHLDYRLECHASPIKHKNGHEWSEDFDATWDAFGIQFLCNMKMICDSGGAQTRSIREVWHFIRCQLEYNSNHKKITFVNIMDGDASYNQISGGRKKGHASLLDLLDKYPNERDKVFIGDMEEFQCWYEKLTKKNNGQFYTTNYKYILSNLHIPNGIDIVEPFVGRGDLLNMLNGQRVETYDIDPKCKAIQRDVLMDPPDYSGKFILTNPPYLARNKNPDKTLYDKYKTNDLYKCFIISLLNSDCIGGILIIPLNFFSSITKIDVNLRQRFLSVFRIDMLNIFEEPVFEDTGYTVCSFQFSRAENSPIKTILYPSKKQITLTIDNTNDFRIGGEIYKLNGQHNVFRITSNNIENMNSYIVLKCIDDTKPLGFIIVEDREKYIDNTPHLSQRSYALVATSCTLSIDEQKIIVIKANELISSYRQKYHSLFLTNYREKNRKRISFELAFNILNHCI